MLGQEVAELVNEYKTAGNYEISFSAIGGSAFGGNAYTLSSGAYFYVLEANGNNGSNFTATKKMILMK